MHDHVFEDKGCKITVKFNILDGPSTELETQLSRVNQAVKEVVEIKSACDRLGVSVTYLQGLLEIGDVEKDMSHSSLKPDYRLIMNTHRSTRRWSLAFP